MAARIPMIATTIMSSIRVKPRCPLRVGSRLSQNPVILFLLVSFDQTASTVDTRLRLGAGSMPAVAPDRSSLWNRALGQAHRAVAPTGPGDNGQRGATGPRRLSVAPRGARLTPNLATPDVDRDG